MSPTTHPDVLDVAALEAVDAEARRLLGADPDAAEELLTSTLSRLEASAHLGPAAAGVDEAVDVRQWLAKLLYARSAQRHYRHDPKALADLELAFDLVNPQKHPLMAALILNGRAIWEGLEGRVEDQIATLGAALSTVQKAADDADRAVPVRVAVRVNLAELLADLGDTERALALLEDALPEALDIGHPGQLEHVYATAVVVSGITLLRPDGVEAMTPDRARALAGLLHEWCRRATEVADEAFAADPVVSNRRLSTFAQARSAQLAGDLETALERARVALALTLDRGEPDHASRCRALVGELLVALGRHDEALPLLREVTAETGRLATAVQVVAWYLLADCYEARGEHREAMDALKSYVRHNLASRDVRLRSTASVASAKVLREVAERERDQARRDSEDASQQARVDPLVGVGNRLAFNEHMAELSRSGSEVTVAVLDLDYFKVVNDLHGHQVGDEVLCVVAHTLAQHLDDTAPGSSLYRIGGEEFAALLPMGEPEAARALEVVEGAREAVSRLVVRLGSNVIQVTISAGMATGRTSDVPGHDGSDRALLSHADHNLYRAKRRGRDRVVAD